MKNDEGVLIQYDDILHKLNPLDAYVENMW